MGDKQTQNEVAQIILDATSCAACLSETIERQNQVMLAYCGALIDQSLRVVASLKEIEKKGTFNTADIGQLKADVIQAVTRHSNEVIKSTAAAANGTAAPQAVKPPDGAVMLNDSNSAVAAFVQSMGNAMHNAVTAQQQMNITTQAATTMAISVIFNSGAAETAAT